MKKFLAVSLVAALAAGAFTGCTSDAKNESSQASTDSSAQTA